ncbi:Asp23/Gls24 family envelope stress response protein [Streptomyces prasinus]|uniref:Asp23/Gls24 family envelope stress response protein n=1 Tax=Streptomyces prasinus TaxID=67345 RepID=UPI0030B89B25
MAKWLLLRVGCQWWPPSSMSLLRVRAFEVRERRAAVAPDVVDYGVSIVDVTGDVRTDVTSAVERMTGLEVGEVNIADVRLPTRRRSPSRRRAA